MEVSKLLTLLGGIITLVATYLFSWFVVDVAGTLYYGHGLGVLFSLPYTFANAETIALSWGSGVPFFVLYIVGGCLILFLFSGVLILLGTKNRAASIIGAIMPIGIAIAVISGPFSVPPNVIDYIQPFSSEALGAFPLHLAIGPSGYNAVVSLGNYLLLGGGILGLVGGVMPRE
ncbi:MAG: hypothetical protein ACFE9S_15530 [Candidatus Hermodarchaeota archaeon]